MHRRLLSLLCCPECRADLSLLATASDDHDRVRIGELRCAGACGRVYPIRNGIPRFVESHEADSSFGFQWNHFREDQLDSTTGADLSAQRFWSETLWTAESLSGEWVIEIGCGAGRFLEVVSTARCDVVGVDVTVAVDAAAKTVQGRSNVHLVQADAYRLPFRAGAFDAGYCIGVAQHTPAPSDTLAALPPLIRRDGRVAVTVYERRPWTLLNGKYVLRSVIKGMSKQTLFKVISATMPVLFPLTEVLFRIPLLGRVFDFAIPVANYVHLKQLSWRQRYRIALLDTFDRLAPTFDLPLTEGETRDALARGGISDISRLPNPGVNLIGVQKGAKS